MKKFSLFFSLILFISCQKVLHVADVQSLGYEIAAVQPTVPDEEIVKMVSPFKEQIDKEMNEIIGESAITMVKARPQSTLGNWMADLIHKKSEDFYKDTVDFAIVNYGGIRLPEIQKGPVTRGKIFELMPFDNMLVILKVKGDVVQLLFDKMADYGGWPISAQVRYEINAGKPINITIKGKPVDPNKIYKIALADFLANGGDQCYFFKEQPRDELSVLFRDAIIQFIEQESAMGKLLDAEMDHRVIIVNE